MNLTQTLTCLLCLLVSKGICQNGAFNLVPLNPESKYIRISERDMYEVTSEENLVQKILYNRFGRISKVITYNTPSNTVNSVVKFFYKHDTIIESNEEVQYGQDNIEYFRNFFEVYDANWPEKKIGKLLSEDSVVFHTRYLFTEDSITIKTTYSDWYESSFSIERNIDKWNRINFIIDSFNNIYIKEIMTLYGKRQEYFNPIDSLVYLAKNYSTISNTSRHDNSIFYSYGKDDRIYYKITLNCQEKMSELSKYEYIKQNDTLISLEFKQIFFNEEVLETYKKYFLGNRLIKEDNVLHFGGPRRELILYNEKGNIKEFCKYNNSGKIIYHARYKYLDR